MPLKTETAYRKLDIMMETYRQYTRSLQESRNTQATVERMAQMRAYAKKLILDKRLDPARYRKFFFQKEYEELLTKRKDH